MKETLNWFKLAKPEPTTQDVQTQIGVHLEEISEMLLVLYRIASSSQVKLMYLNAFNAIHELATYTKSVKGILDTSNLPTETHIELLDSIVDQAVTGMGMAQFLGYDFEGALQEVNRSNYSKFDNEGKPMFLANGKIAKSENYTPPELTPYITSEKTNG